MALVDIAFPAVWGHGQPRKELEDVESFDIEVENSGQEPVPTINRRRRPRGFKKGVQKQQATITTRLSDPFELDWIQLMRRGRLFQFGWQYAENGQRWHLKDCSIKSLRNGNNQEGDVTLEITIEALDLLPED